MLELFVLNQSDAKTILNGNYSDFLPAAFTLAHRALAAAEILARPAALILDFFFGAGVGVEAFAGEPRMEASSFSNALILSLMSAACFSCAEVSDNRLLMVKPV